MKKKILLYIDCFLIIFSLTSCNSGNKGENPAFSDTSEIVDYIDEETLNEYTGDKVSDVVIDEANATQITLGSTKSTTSYSSTSTKLKIETSGTYEITGTLKGNVKINTTSKVTLILNNVTITSDEQAINCESLDFYLIIKENSVNTLTDGSSYEKGNTVINCDGKVTIDGTGTLNLVAKSKSGIKANDIIVWNANINVTEAVTDGLHADSSVIVNSGNLNFTVTSDGIESEGTITIEGGSIYSKSSSDGLVAAGNLTINNGVIVVVKAAEGIESKNSITINGGYIQINCTDDGLNASKKITINDGKIYIVSSAGDGIDSNGTILITGGVTVAFGTTQPETGIDCDNNELKITGGFLLACGGSNSSATSSVCTQNVLNIGTSVTQNAYVNVSNGTTNVLTFKAPRSSSAIMFSSSSLVTGETYTASTGVSVTGTEGFACLYTNTTCTGVTSVGSVKISSIVSSIGSTSGGGTKPGGRP